MKKKMEDNERETDRHRRNANPGMSSTKGRPACGSSKDLEGLESSILGALPHAVIGLKGRTIIFANSPVKSVLGWKPEELIGKNARILYRTAGEYEEINKHLDAAHRKRKIYIKEFPCHRKDGKDITCSICIATVQESAEQKQIVLLYEDITEQIRAKELLLQSEERFRDLYDSAPVGYHELDVKGRIKSVNRTELDMLGYTAKEMLGRPVWKFIGEGEKSRITVLAKLGGILPPVRSFERLYMRKNGTTFPVLVEDRILRNKEGMITGIRSTIEDITERKKIEEEIEKHRNQLEHLVAERTAELMQTNEKLQAEIGQRKVAVDELRASKEDLENKSRTLEELNTALKVLLRQREEDRKDLEERFTSNIKSLVLPYVEKMKKGRIDTQQHSCLSVIEANLNEIVSPFLHTIRESSLTPREIQVASLIKDGRTTKEIAEIIGVGSSAIDSYRKSIRNKLKLSNQKINLQSYLKTLQ
jgi:PAS domain S-box-containing protein